MKLLAFVNGHFESSFVDALFVFELFDVGLVLVFECELIDEVHHVNFRQHQAVSVEAGA